VKKSTVQLGAAVFWLVAAAGWLIIAALNRFEVLYLAASGLSVLAGGTTLFARRQNQRQNSKSK